MLVVEQRQRVLAVAQCLLVRRSRQCLPARESKVADGLRFVGQATGQIEMSSELGRMLVQAVRVRRLDRLGDAQVQPLTPRQRERPQKRLGISSCVKL